MSILIKSETKNSDADLFLEEPIPAHDFSPSMLLKMEKEILGIHVSSHPLTIYRQKLPSPSSRGYLHIRSHHISQLRSGQLVLIAGLLIQVRRQFTRNHKVMAFLLLEDETGFFEAIAFPETFRRYHSLLVKDALLLLRGDINNKNGEEKLMIKEIAEIPSHP